MTDSFLAAMTALSASLGLKHARMVSPVVFFLPTVCKGCGEEFVNRAKLHNHDCQRRLDLAAPPALAWRRRLAERASSPAEPVLAVGEGVH